MTETSQLVSYSLATAFGLVMVAAAAVQADGAPLIAATHRRGCGVDRQPNSAGGNTCRAVDRRRYRPGERGPSARGAVGPVRRGPYLVLRHTGTVATPTVVGAAAFTAAGLAATSIAVRLPWAPLVAPIAVLVLYVLITRPFWREGSTR